MNSELGGMWKEVAVIQFALMSWCRAAGLTGTTRVSFRIRAVLHPEPTEHNAGVLASCLQVSARDEHNTNPVHAVTVFVISIFSFVSCFSPWSLPRTFTLDWKCVCVCWQPCEVHWPVQWSLISNRSGYKIIVLNLSVADDMRVLREGTTASYWETGK